MFSSASIMLSFLKESLAGPGYVILNAIRVLNIIAFLDIIAANAVMLVKISLLTSFFFFQAVAHVMSAGVSSMSSSSLPPFLPPSLFSKHTNRYHQFSSLSRSFP